MLPAGAPTGVEGGTLGPGLTPGAAKADPQLGECGRDFLLQQLSILSSSRVAEGITGVLFKKCSMLLPAVCLGKGKAVTLLPGQFFSLAESQLGFAFFFFLSLICPR